MDKAKEAKVFEVIRYELDGTVRRTDYVAAESAKAIKAALVSVKPASRGTLDRMAIMGAKAQMLVVPVATEKAE